MQKLKKYLHQKRTINSFDIMVFLRQLATLINANVPILQCLDILEMSQEKNALRLIIYTIKKEILTGKSLYNSLASQPRYFDHLTCQLIRIGEHTGKLEKLLFEIAAYKEKQWQFKQKIQQSLFYPLIIFFTALATLLFMFAFVIPRFEALFQDSSVDLPGLTRVIFYLSNQIHHYYLVCPIFLIFTAYIAYYYKMHLLQQLQAYFTYIPYINVYFHKIILAHFARHLALTYSAGLSITQALPLCGMTYGSVKFRQIVMQLHKQIDAGVSLHRAMTNLSYFPALMIQMIKIGEDSGALDIMLDKTADFFEADFDRFITKLSQLVEPLIIVVLGVLIGCLVVGLYLPVFKLGTAI